jgi:hypothetical protein
MMAERAWIDVFLVHPAQSADGPLTRLGRGSVAVQDLGFVKYLSQVKR